MLKPRASRSTTDESCHPPTVRGRGAGSPLPDDTLSLAFDQYASAIEVTYDDRDPVSDPQRCPASSNHV